MAAKKTLSASASLQNMVKKLNRLAELGVQIVEEGAGVTMAAIKRLAYTKTPRRTGSAAGQWVIVNKVRRGKDLINVAPHWQFIREGTGEFGPRGEKIRPKGGKKVFFRGGDGKVLAFVKEGDTKFKKWSRGMPARDPMGQVNVAPPLAEGDRYVRDKLGRFMKTGSA